ncbi:alpha/beta hydrolase family protein [Microbacterium nymphoidis]|uniref:alpha/beta hydrolase family protein n=1 Tax=Microbacterium nymphoidis TaxID=2898586 RepID=UPI001E3FB769|nr:alpha/beta family hydrolase [Microbacterium nymphoidis]MCD2496939.1 dienelactone hydrolase family protein [Microbacterium nymphoidis]
MTSGVADTVPVLLPTGAEVEVHIAVEPAPDARATMILAHGAGSTMDHGFLVGLATALRAGGIATVRFNFPYVEAGRRMPGPAAHALATWGAVAAHVRSRSDLTGPVWFAGRSYGGRMASMAVADGLATSGLVYLGYPLHAPGKPESPRAEHLSKIAQPQLFISGTRDPFVDPHAQLEEAVSACSDARLHWVEGGTHGFEVKGNKRPADVIGAELASIVRDFVLG